MNYALQACLNLAAEFALRGDREAVLYYESRIRALKREQAKGSRKS